jgi:single-stranded DNA-binding protein
MLNRVSLVGEVGEYGPRLTYRENGQPECTLTVVIKEPSKDGQTVYRTFVPVVLYGVPAEKSAAELEPGMIIAVDGKLAWRGTGKKSTDGKAEGKLAVMASSVHVIQPTTADSAH